MSNKVVAAVLVGALALTMLYIAFAYVTLVSFGTILELSLEREVEIVTVTKEVEKEVVRETIVETIVEPDGIKYAGTFTCTAYDLSGCGKAPDDPWYGITAGGTTATEGRTIAADWSVLPKGTVVYIEGVGVRTVEDVGGAIKGYDIDVFIPDHTQAMVFGVQKLEVWILEPNEKGDLQ
jgi:3D (Asp-Asp-Asp) domain-containing protein